MSTPGSIRGSQPQSIQKNDDLFDVGGSDDFGFEGESSGVNGNVSRYQEAKVSERDLGQMTVGDAKDFLDNLIMQVRSDLNLSDEDRKKILSKLTSLQTSVGHLKNDQMAFPKNLISQFMAIQADLIAKSTPEPDESQYPLNKQIERFRANFEKSDSLIPEKKKAISDQLDKLRTGINLKTMSPEKIAEEFEALKEQVATLSLQPQGVQRLANLLPAGTDLSEVTKLFDKYGIKPDKLPNLSNPSDPEVGKLAQLLNDPLIADSLGLNAAKQKVSQAAGDLKNEIAKQTQTARKLNQEAEADKDKERSSDDSSYRFLYDAHFKQDAKSKALIDARREYATKVASALSALTGQVVSAVPPTTQKEGDFVNYAADQAGAIQVGDRVINVIPNSMNPELSFVSASAGIDWPAVELIPYGVDTYEDGKKEPPEWMKDSGYPMYAYQRDETPAWKYMVTAVFFPPLALKYAGDQSVSKNLADNFDAAYKTGAKNMKRMGASVDTSGAPPPANVGDNTPLPSA